MMCGAIFSKPKVKIDTEKNPVYEFVTAERFLKAIAVSKDTAEKNYDDKFILISGLFESHDASKKCFTIMNSERKSVTCEYDKTFKGNIDEFIYKDSIAVYGKCNVSFGKFTITDVKKIIRAHDARSSEQYYTIDGTNLDKASATERTLSDGKIKYYIPSTWKSIEKNIYEEELGTIEGYQYVLNRLPDGNKSEPESLFVCYFDKNLLKDAADIKSTEDVEKMMIKNIEGNVGSFPSVSTTTYYDADYKYYLGKYTDIMDIGKGYHTEYVFQKHGNSGIIMYLYLYREPKHISDVMLITRLLDIEK